MTLRCLLWKISADRALCYVAQIENGYNNKTVGCISSQAVYPISVYYS